MYERDYGFIAPPQLDQKKREKKKHTKENNYECQHRILLFVTAKVKKKHYRAICLKCCRLVLLPTKNCTKSFDIRRRKTTLPRRLAPAAYQRLLAQLNIEEY